MSIRITNPKSKMPEGLKLMSKIGTYLFDEEGRECKYMRASEIEALRKAMKALSRASKRTAK